MPWAGALLLAAGLLAGAALPQARGRGAPQLYVCRGSQCVLDSRGLPLEECARVCGIPPAPPAPAPDPEGGLDIVQLAESVGELSFLATLIEGAGLAKTLSGPGPFTVFAPTNDAFAKLPKGTVETLLKPENKEKLQAILTYHVLSGKVTAAEVKPAKVKTLNGASVNIKAQGGKVMVDGAQVVKTDIIGSNGVIHVIDSVILPSK